MTDKTPTTMAILLHPHPTLSQKALPVAAVDDRIRGLLNSMLATLYAADGVGLAANQVGLLERLVVIDVGVPGPEGKPDFKQKHPILMVNPEIISASETFKEYEEGCLSLPGVYGPVERPETVTVRYLDEHGKTQELDADGLLAVCVQHEIDHLDGVLFPQRMSRLKSQMTLKKYTKKRADFIAEPGYDALTAERGIIKAAGK